MNQAKARVRPRDGEEPGVIINNEGKSRESNTRKSRKKRSTTTTVTAIDPNAAAAAAASIMAQKAMKAAQGSSKASSYCTGNVDTWRQVLHND